MCLAAWSHTQALALLGPSATEDGANLRHERPVPDGTREGNPLHSAEVAMRVDGRRERRREPVVGEGVEAVLPPQAYDVERLRPSFDARLDRKSVV